MNRILMALLASAFVIGAVPAVAAPSPKPKASAKPMAKATKKPMMKASAKPKM
jgi:hypothetical protein